MHARNFGSHMTARPDHREKNVKCHILYLVRESVTSVDNKHPYYSQLTAVNSVSADQYHVALPQAHVTTYQGTCFL